MNGQRPETYYKRYSGRFIRTYYTSGGEQAVDSSFDFVRPVSAPVRASNRNLGCSIFPMRLCIPSFPKRALSFALLYNPFSVVEQERGSYVRFSVSPCFILFRFPSHLETIIPAPFSRVRTVPVDVSRRRSTRSSVSSPSLRITLDRPARGFDCFPPRSEPSTLPCERLATVDLPSLKGFPCTREANLL